MRNEKAALRGAAFFFLNLTALANPACAPCHRALYDAYQQSSMARTSGIVTSAILSNARIDQPSIGATFTVDAAARTFSFQRKAKGTRPLHWFIGSGKVGRSFAFADDNFLFQAPVSYFARDNRWGVSPGFEDRKHVDIARPIEEPCLQCHATRPRLIRGTANRYEGGIAEPGITCERCHGTGKDHQVVNPAKLDPERRANVCEQCHLTGAAKVVRQGKRQFDYQPGLRLRDFVTVYVGGNRQRAASDHAEQLQQSRCAQQSGDKLWCGTCHSIHSESKPACATCHQPPACKQAARGTCAGCHMPKQPSREHVAFTDHTISIPGKKRQSPFRAYWPNSGDARDLALATNNVRTAASDDIDSLVQLAQRRNDIALYERVYALDPLHPAAANLGILRAQKGMNPANLWLSLFDRYPHMLPVGLNLLSIYNDEALRRRIDRFHPDR